MPVTIRPVAPADTAECGRVIYASFSAFANHHRFECEFPSLEDSVEEVSGIISNPGFHGFVAEIDGRLVGSNFAELRSPIAGIGPVSVDPELQGKGIGQMLMQASVHDAWRFGVAGIRLGTQAHHSRSLALYTRLGFQTREPLTMIQGKPLGICFSGYEVRPAVVGDLAACNAMCRAIHGFERSAELEESIRLGGAKIVEHLGHFAGYSTGMGFFCHAIAESNQALKALIGAAEVFNGIGFVVPMRNHEVLSWCLERGLQMVIQGTLMTVGLYNEPLGSYLPSASY